MLETPRRTLARSVYGAVPSTLALIWCRPLGRVVRVSVIGEARDGTETQVEKQEQDSGFPRQPKRTPRLQFMDFLGPANSRTDKKNHPHQGC